MRGSFLIAVLVASLTSAANAHELIVKFKKLKSGVGNARALRAAVWRGAQPLVAEHGLYLIKSKDEMESASQALAHVRSFDEVEYAQLNHHLRKRSAAPNDPLFQRLWALEHTGVTRVWARHGTGGKDVSGNEIALAVVDDGVDLAHEDLRGNLWANPGEVPDDGLDNDGNGYVDDVHGYNMIDDSPKLRPRRHGTHVAGIMGASGNNGLHVTGLNWNVKLVAVASGNETAQVVKAYGYLIALKKAWLASGGKYGANVVASNSSFGIDLVKCTDEDYPVWNDLYNEMGRLGILSVIATSNIPLDADVKGDVPATCDSPFTIVVTNTMANDRKFPEAAWGATSVDLGAPGDDIVSTVPGNKTMMLFGTSMAAPQVTGAIGLLHSLASSEFNLRYLARPADAVLELKEALLRGVDSINDLRGRTVSGGRLNVEKAAAIVRDN